MELTNKLIEEIGYKRINKSMFRRGNITIQNWYTDNGGDIWERILSTKKAYKICVNGKFREIITTQKKLINIEQSVGNF